MNLSNVSFDSDLLIPNDNFIVKFRNKESHYTNAHLAFAPNSLANKKYFFVKVKGITMEQHLIYLRLNYPLCIYWLKRSKKRSEKQEREQGEREREKSEREKQKKRDTNYCD